MRRLLLGNLLGLVLCATAYPAAARRSVQGPPPGKPPTTGFSTQPFVIEEFRTHFRFEDAGTGRKEQVIRVRIQSEAGVQRWGQLTFGYAPASESLQVTQFEVRKPDGSVVRGDAAAIQDAAVQPGAGSQVFQDLRQKHLTVPALKVGDTLAVRVQWTIHAALAPGHFFVEHDFIGDAIVVEEWLEIDVPAPRHVTIKVAPDAPEEVTKLKGNVAGARRTYRWKSSHTASREDPSEPTNNEEEPEPPAVRLSTFRDWAELARWYASLAGPAAAVDDKVRAKAESLTRGLAGDLEKIQAIYDYVSAEIRYVSLSFGAGRYAPHPAAEVLANQYGDCKDKHTLLAAMLRAIGIDAWAALANSTRKIDPEMPSPLEFDHVLTAVPRGTAPQEWLWLDTTPGVAPFGMLTSNHRDKQTLVAVSSGARSGGGTPGRVSGLARTPAEPPFPSDVSVDVEGTVNVLGVLEARVRQSFRGDAELLLRLILRGTSQEQWAELARKLAESQQMKGTVTDPKITNLSTTREPLVLEYKLRRPGQFEWTKSGALLTLPLPPQTFPAATEEAWKGRARLRLGAPGTATVRATLQLPEAYKPNPPLGVSLTRDALEYHSSYRFAGRTVQSERVLRVRGSEVPGSGASEYLSLVRSVRSDESQRVSLEFDTRTLPAIPAEATAQELYSAANAAYKSGNHEGARAFWQRVVELEPKHPDGWDALGFAYEKLKRPADAVAAFRKQIEVNPFHKQAHEDLARVLEDLEDDEGARAALARHLEINPLDGDALGKLGGLLLDMDRFEEAATQLEKAVSVVRNDAWLFARLGVSYLEQKAYDKARVALEKAVEISATPAIWTYTGWNRAEHGQDLERAAELANKTLTHAASVMQKVRVDAIDAEHLDLVERVGWSWDAMGWIHYQKGELSASERYLKSASMLSGDIDMTYHLARLFEKQGRTTDAGTAYLTAAARSSNPRPEVLEGVKRFFGPEADLKNAEKAAVGMELQQRVTRLPIADPGPLEARFFILLKPDGTVSGASFVSGDEKLRPHAQALTKLRFGIRFPDETVPVLPVRVHVKCGAPGGGCFALPERPAAVARAN